MSLENPLNLVSAYLDIETTGLSPSCEDLTVIGMCVDDGKKGRVMQLVGDEISSVKLIEIMENVKVLYTYNGLRFDLPFINAKLGLDLSRLFIHRDLMFDCWKRNLYGGLKNVERLLGINRNTDDIDGRVAVLLWQDYKNNGNKESLKTLLEYNREDVLNLKELRKKLNV